MKKIYLVMIGLLVLTACKKEAELQLSYPSLYKSIRYESTSQVRLYTRNGEVTDRVVVDRFTKQYGKDFLYNNGFVMQLNQTDSVRILSPTSAEIKEGLGFKSYGLTIQKNDLQFVPKDTFSVTSIDEYWSDISVAIGKHKPFYYEKIPLSSITGFAYMYRIAVGRFATATANYLDFPMLNYTLAQGSPPYQSVYSRGNINNTFDETAYKQLRAVDTLAIQEFRVRFEK